MVDQCVMCVGRIICVNILWLRVQGGRIQKLTFVNLSSSSITTMAGLKRRVKRDHECPVCNTNRAGQGFTQHVRLLVSGSAIVMATSLHQPPRKRACLRSFGTRSVLNRSSV